MSIRFPASSQCCLLALWLCWSPAWAADYWVVGSFNNPPNAVAEASRIADESGLDIRVLMAGDLSRVVLKKDPSPEGQKQLLQAMGLSPWTFSAVDSVVASSMQLKTVDRPPAAAQVIAEAAQLAAAPPIETAVITPPVAGENLAAYCAKRANKFERARYCASDVLVRSGALQAQMNAPGDASDLIYCSLHANAAQRRRNCQH